MKKLLPLFIVIIIALGLKASALAIPLTFTKIAECKSATGSPVGEFLGSASINNSGMVAFAAQNGVFVGSGGGLTTITSNFPSSYLSGTVDINSAGEVAFQYDYNGVFKSSGGLVSTIADTSMGFSDFGGHPTINDAGVVAFNGYGVNSGIFTGDGGALTTIADTSGPFWGVTGPSINSNGLVSFKGYLEDGGEGIYTGSGGAITTIASTSSTFVGNFGGGPAVNDSGTVAFKSRLEGGPPWIDGVFTGSGGSISYIADNSGPFYAIDSNPSINNSGMVAFKARTNVSVPGGWLEEGIFVGSDPILDKVIGTGDLLDGSTVLSILSFYDGLNDLGQIAFAVTLADGRDAIFRADPLSPVPEPSTIFLMGLGLAGLIGIRARKKS